MPSPKKLASLRLDEEILRRVDAVIDKIYAGMPGKPSRNAVLEAWVIRELEEAEKSLEKK